MLVTSIITVVLVVSLAQLFGTMHKICKVRGSNPSHYKKKLVLLRLSLDFILLKICSSHFLNSSFFNRRWYNNIHFLKLFNHFLN